MTGLVFSPLVPIWLLYILTGAAAVLLIYGAWRRARGVLLRTLPIAALILAIADPQLVKETHSALKDIVVVAVDDSDSQKIGDRQERSERALATLTAELAATTDLEVRTVHAGHEDATGHQDGTQLFSALTAAMSDIPAKRLAGAILITDGQIHDTLSPERAAEIHAPYLNAPLHVLLSGEHREFDRRIRVESAADFGIVGQPVSVRLRAEDTSVNPGAPLPVTIRRNNEQTQQVMLPNGRTLEVPIPIPAAGPNVFEVEVEAAKGELSTANNHAMVSINGVRDRTKVLLVSGQPHVGERSWRNLLKSDPNIDLVHFTILRPLEKDDGTPLNELALISFPLRELFEERLKEFDLIIFDRYSQRGLIPVQYMSNIANYVRNGGAIMLTVGAEYADNYSLFSGPLQNVLPGQPTGRVYTGTFRPRVSPTGHRHPVTSTLGENFALDAEREPDWGRWLRQIQVTRPAGEAVMTGQDNEPLLLLNRVGRGRVALLLSDTIWLWGKGFDGGGPQVELMRRISHWLMKEPDLEEEALSAFAQNGALTVTRHSLSAEEMPVTVTTPTGQQQTAVVKDTGKGAFTAQLPITETGVYRLTDGKNNALAAVDAPNPKETYDVVTTEERVTPVVNATGGGVYWLTDGAVPAIRRMTASRVAHGATWMGLKSNNEYVVTGVTQYPLAPLGMIVLLVMAGALLAWWREGR